MNETERNIRIVPNGILLNEVRQLVNEGHPVKLRVKGSSMLPFIVGDRDDVLITKSATYRKSDIALAEVGKDHYVLHRLISVEGCQPDDKVILMGDGVLKNQEHCRIKNIVGLVTVIYRNGKPVDAYCRSERMIYHIWKGLKPCRRYLLAVIRRLSKFKAK